MLSVFGTIIEIYFLFFLRYVLSCVYDVIVTHVRRGRKERCYTRVHTHEDTAY